MSHNSAVWYAHTVEELVIWTVEREYGKYLNCVYTHMHTSLMCFYINTTVCTIVDYTFEKFIRYNKPLQPVTLTATTPFHIYCTVLWTHHKQFPEINVPPQWLLVNSQILCLSILFWWILCISNFANYYDNSLH